VGIIGSVLVPALNLARKKIGQVLRSSLWSYFLSTLLITDTWIRLLLVLLTAFLLRLCQKLSFHPTWSLALPPVWCLS